jgi:hypothetical protein
VFQGGSVRVEETTYFGSSFSLSDWEVSFYPDRLDSGVRLSGVRLGHLHPLVIPRG